MSRLNVANFRHPDGTADNLNLDSSGRVGMGTASPAGNTGTRLVLHDSSSPRLRLTNSTTGETASDGGEISLDGSNLHIENRESAAIRFYNGGSERAQLDSSGNLRFNSGYGSVATAYGCRAWVNFNGSGTLAIREDGNVTSVTDNGTGDYTVNFTAAMPDANYSYALSGSQEFANCDNMNPHTIATGSFRFQTFNVDNDSASRDYDQVSVVIFR